MGKSPLYRDAMLLLVLIAVATVTEAASQTALDRYVARPDPAYGYTLYQSGHTLAYRSYLLMMRSQQWRKPEEVDRTLWEHELGIVVPELLHSASPHTALLIIDGGSNGKPPTTEVDDFVVGLAITAGSVVATLKQIPNQPLVFADETERSRGEDELLAYSLDKFITTGDPEWPVHLAMTKAVVRAMDTIVEVLHTRGTEIEDFILIGGSKRGWTAWLTAAVDNRVKAIVPISIDLLNMEQQFLHHWEALGFYAPAIVDYADFDIPCRARSKRGQELLEIIDPYAYRARYTLPKLLVNSAGDEFFVSDSSRFYYSALQEPKALRYTFNTGHAQGESLEQLLDVALASLAWIDDVNHDRRSPRYSWSFEPDGSIRVITEDRPDAVYLVQATNPNARDFRLPTIGEAWSRQSLGESGNGVYIGFVPPPAQGWSAFAVELVYDKFSIDRQVFTTDVRVTPDRLPFQGLACQATTPGVLENPAPEAWQSGISVLSGWACDAEQVDLRIDDKPVIAAGHGTPRGDTRAICGDRDNGFGLLYNFSLLGDGEHQVTALVDGRDLASARFRVQTLGQPFVTGLSGSYELADFPRTGQYTKVTWEEPLQNFLISGVTGMSSDTAVPAAIAVRADSPGGKLENPRSGSTPSGVSIISGWVCEAASVTIVIDDGEPIPAHYGTTRNDTQEVCGESDNGFGLLFNWNLLGDGPHTLRAIADGNREIGRASFEVVTLGAEFIQGLSGTFELPGFPNPGASTTIEWQEPMQNFSLRTPVGE